MYIAPLVCSQTISTPFTRHLPFHQWIIDRQQHAIDLQHQRHRFKRWLPSVGPCLLGYGVLRPATANIFEHNTDIDSSATRWQPCEHTWVDWTKNGGLSPLSMQPWLDSALACPPEAASANRRCAPIRKHQANQPAPGLSTPGHREQSRTSIRLISQATCGRQWRSCRNINLMYIYRPLHVCGGFIPIKDLLWTWSSITMNYSRLPQLCIALSALCPIAWAPVSNDTVGANK